MNVKFIWISIGNLDPTIIFVILEWLLLGPSILVSFNFLSFFARISTGS